MEAVRSSTRFDYLDEQTQRIMEILLNSPKAMSEHVTKQLREHTTLFMGVVSQLVSRLELVTEEVKSRKPGNCSSARVVYRAGDVSAEVEMFEVGHEEESRLRTSINTTILNDLWYTSMTDRYEDVMEAYPETFEWIYVDSASDGLRWDNFSEWLKTGSGVYWISGKAGSGKSTLMKHIFDDSRTHEYLTSWEGDYPLCIATFFFWGKGGCADQRSQTGMLRALLHQALNQYRELIPVVFPTEWASLYSASINHLEVPKTKWTLRQLLNAFTTFARQTIIPLKTCLFIDGLDEFEGDLEAVEELASSLKEITSSVSFNVKVCVSSRPWMSFEDIFASGPCLRLHTLTASDIEFFVAGKLNENSAFQTLASKDPTMTQALVDEIVSTAQGVFLWVRLVVKSLLIGIRNRDSIAILQSRLRSLPRELEPLYTHLMSLIDPVYLPWASKAFQIAHLSRGSTGNGTQNPIGEGNSLSLSIAEFHIALTDEVDATFFETTRFGEFDHICRETEIHLTARCAGLLEVHGLDPDPFMRRVEYLHKTVGDFLGKGDHWPNILAHTSRLEFDSNLSIVKASVLSLVARAPVDESNYMTDGLWGGPREQDQKYCWAATILACRTPKQTTSYDLQKELFDFMDTCLCDCTPDNSMTCWSSWPAGLIDHTRPIASFLKLARLSHQRCFLHETGSKSAAGGLSKIATLLLHYLLVSPGLIKNTPKADPPMVLLLLSFGADPHQWVKGWTVWKHTVHAIQRDCQQGLGKLEIRKLLKIMRILASAPPTNDDFASGQISAWRVLIQAPLQTHPEETKEALLELERKMRPGDLSLVSMKAGSTWKTFRI
jgi:hypothetical protein